MTRLIVSPESDASQVEIDTEDPSVIAAELATVGVRFEQWKASHLLADGAGQDAVLAAYHDDVQRLSDEGGYVTVDVIRLARNAETDEEWSEKVTTSRHRFLAEHTHDDDEVRFFVEGEGAFYLRLNSRVHIVHCLAGDLLSVPADTRHWFDMGTSPRFAAIRFFRMPEGWVGNFTGDEIASRFPSLDSLRSA